jgi:nitroreductase
MDVQEAIQKKRAVRQFSDKPVPEDVIRAILDAGRRSQSSRNSQAWQFVVVQNRDTLQALAQTTGSVGHIGGAAFAVVLVGTDEGLWNHFDLGQAAAYLQLAAWEQGVGSGIAGFHHEDEVRAILGIPAGMSCFVALSFGYPAADFAPAKRGGRKPLDEVVRWEKW